MTTTTVTDTDIFAKLREHVSGTSMLTQLLVDTTNKAMEDAAFRDELIERLGVIPAVSTENRPYNLTLANLRKVYPGVNAEAIPLILKYAPQYDILTKKQMCSFLSNCIVESNGFNAKRESFAYTAGRLRQVFSTRIASIAAAKKLLAKGQVATANYLYGGRYGNRPGTNDGWDYRGGGIIQNTFRSNYYILQNMTGIPFGENPKHIEDLENAVKAAMAFWQLNGCNTKAEKINTYDDGYTLNTLTSKGIETKDYKMNYGARIVRETVNGGLNGYEHFCQTLEKCLRYL
ncbi:glycoside hydrolase family 19 protein [Psychrobacter piscatorii]|uniref:glycoside hydrolase family 19 protein n=1 Tax=Psychrobacter piscatorii TaxID=554343 RepID=UPI0037360CD1